MITGYYHILAFIFDLNGFHDAANSIATIVLTHVLKPHWAALWAAFLILLHFYFGIHVASTIGTGLIDPSIINTQMILAVSFFLNIFAQYFSIPSSSSCIDWRGLSLKLVLRH